MKQAHCDLNEASEERQEEGVGDGGGAIWTLCLRDDDQRHDGSRTQRHILGRAQEHVHE